MTGMVTWEVLIWVVGLVVAAGIGVAGFLLWVWGVVRALRDDWQKKLDARGDDWQKELDARDLKIEAVNARATLIEAEHNEYRVHVAEKFATKDGVTQAIGRMEAAVDKLTTQVHDAVERLTDRLDRVLDRGNEGGRRD